MTKKLTIRLGKIILNTKIGFSIEFDDIKTTITQLSMEECKNRIEVIGNKYDSPELLEEL